MKKVKLILSFILCFVLGPLLTYAASGSISISSANTIVVGNKVTVTVTLSGNDIGSWSMQLNYDKNYLKLTNSSAEGGGNFMVGSSTSGIKSKKYTFTFQALKNGTTTLSMGGYEAYAFSNMEEISLSAGSKQIRIITQQELEASYSKDNNLKSLAVDGYELTPEFNKDNVEYSVTVPEGTTSVHVSASVNDSKASLSGDGDISVSEGTNTIKLVVRAENGSEKVYTIIVNVIDENPINVQIDGEDFTVIKLRDNYKCPNLFLESETTIGEFTIPTCYNDKIKYTLVGLKRSDGSLENYIYENGKYRKYQEIVGTSLNIIILDYDKEIDNLKASKEKIDGKEYNVYKVSDKSKTYIVYGVNVETGEKNFYSYDTVSKTFSLYDTELIDNLKEENKIYVYVIIAFGVCLFLLIICLISVSCSKKKVIRKIKEREQNIEEKNKKEVKEIKERKEEEIDIVNDNTDYNILREEKKRKRKKN